MRRRPARLDPPDGHDDEPVVRLHRLRHGDAVGHGHAGGAGHGQLGAVPARWPTAGRAGDLGSLHLQLDGRQHHARQPYAQRSGHGLQRHHGDRGAGDGDRAYERRRRRGRRPAPTVDQSCRSPATAPSPRRRSPPRPAGETLVAFVGSDGPSGAGRQTVTVSGGGLTWTLVKRSNGQSGDAEIWPRSAAGTLTNVTVTSTPAHRRVRRAADGAELVNGAGGAGASAANSAASGAPGREPDGQRGRVAGLRGRQRLRTAATGRTVGAAEPGFAVD